MFKTRIFFLIFIFSISSAASELKSSIEKALKSIPEWQSKTTILIAENPEKIIFENQANKSLIPASVTKILTSAAVMKNFPLGTKLKTQIYSDGKNLYLKGGGDPGFVSESMWFLVNHFVRSGTHQISGDLIVDDSLFDKLRFDPSRQKERVDRAYDAPISAMSFNWNSINIFVRPAKKIGEKAEVFLDPESDYATLKSDVTTVSGIAQDLIVDRDERSGGDHILVKGKIGINAKEAVVFKNITKPDLWAGHQLRSFLKQRGVHVLGDVKSGITPASAELVAESESKPIEQMLIDMNKFSNNFVAEMLTKNLGALDSKPGTLDKGVKLILDYVQNLKIQNSEVKIVNPSGLTRENRLSSKVLWQVLWDLHSRLQTSPEFLSSLPIAGVDGTLKKRMKGTVAERWVRAKTGYLDGVVSLAGYAGRADGQVITFSLIYNGSTDEARVRASFDEVMKVLVQ